MTQEQHARVGLDELEIGLYRQGTAVIAYVNQGPICLLRQRIELLPELSGEGTGAVDLDTLRRVAMTVRIDSRKE